jgi:excisionase family DNA binding protein
MDRAEIPETLLDARTVARWLGLAVATVYEQAARGVLPTVKLWKGKRRTLIRFRRSDIDTFIQDRASASLDPVHQRPPR